MFGTLLNQTGKAWNLTLSFLPPTVQEHLKHYLSFFTWSRALLVLLMTLSLLGVTNALRTYLITSYHALWGEMVFWCALAYGVQFIYFRLPLLVRYDRVGSGLGITLALLLYFF